MKGKHIVITRAVDQVTELREILLNHGADVLLYPCIAVAPLEDTTSLDSTLEAVMTGAFDWVVFTSANAALALSQRLEIMRLTPAIFAGIAVAAVGPATSTAIQKYLKLEVQLMPEESIAKALAAALRLKSPARMLVLQADVTQSALSKELTAGGSSVTSVATYRTVQGCGGINLSSLLANKQVDAITFTNSFIVRNCLRRLTAEGGNLSHLSDVCLACIGPTTAYTVQQLGFSVAVKPAKYTLEGLVAGLEAYFQEKE